MPPSVWNVCLGLRRDELIGMLGLIDLDIGALAAPRGASDRSAWG